jgi:hypothetical protein
VFPGTPSTAEALIEVSATLIHDFLVRAHVRPAGARYGKTGNVARGTFA